MKLSDLKVGDRLKSPKFPKWKYEVISVDKWLIVGSDGGNTGGIIEPRGTYVTEDEFKVYSSGATRLAREAKKVATQTMADHSDYYNAITGVEP